MHTQVAASRISELARVGRGGGTIALHLRNALEAAKWDLPLALLGWKFSTQVVINCNGNHGVWNPSARTHPPPRADMYYVWQRNSIVRLEDLCTLNSFMWMKANALGKAREDEDGDDDSDDTDGGDAPGGKPTANKKVQAKKAQVAVEDDEDGKSRMREVKPHVIWKASHVISDSQRAVGKARMTWEEVRTQTSPNATTPYMQHVYIHMTRQAMYST